MSLNPYAPTSSSIESHSTFPNTAKYLARAVTVYRWIGFIGIAYFVIVYPFALWTELNDPPIEIGPFVAATLASVFFVFLFSLVIHTAGRISTRFDSLYSRARWTGLLAGACGFPFLTIPAFYAVWLVGQVRKARSMSDEPGDAFESPS